MSYKPLVTAGLTSPGGMDPFETQAYLTSEGTNLYCYAQDWSDIEPMAGKYNLPDTITNPLTMLVPLHPYNGVLLVVKMIDTNRRCMPEDLNTRAFNDSRVVQRFLAMLHAIAAQPSAKKLTHILLGNEVDCYLRNHSAELGQFTTLLGRGIKQLHTELPGVRVGTIVTRDVLSDFSMFSAITTSSDFVVFTYYPVRIKDGKTWQMIPVADTRADLVSMAQAAPTKRFAFTEIGYSASPVNDSSEDAQAAFVETVFDTLEPYKDRVEFMSWSSFADYPPEFLQGYADSQGIAASEEFGSFLGNIGLRTYNNTARKSWDVFTAKMNSFIA